MQALRLWAVDRGRGSCAHAPCVGPALAYSWRQCGRQLTPGLCAVCRALRSSSKRCRRAVWRCTSSPAGLGVTRGREGGSCRNERVCIGDRVLVAASAILPLPRASAVICEAVSRQHMLVTCYPPPDAIQSPAPRHLLAPQGADTAHCALPGRSHGARVCKSHELAMGRRAGRANTVRS